MGERDGRGGGGEGRGVRVFWYAVSAVLVASAVADAVLRRWLTCEKYVDRVRVLPGLSEVSADFLNAGVVVLAALLVWLTHRQMRLSACAAGGVCCRCDYPLSGSVCPECGSDPAGRERLLLRRVFGLRVLRLGAVLLLAIVLATESLASACFGVLTGELSPERTAWPFAAGVPVLIWLGVWVGLVGVACVQVARGFGEWRAV